MTSKKELTTVQQTAGNFEAISISNGNTHWTTSALREWLGYSTAKSFRQVISKAMAVCQTLQIPIYKHFKSIGRDEFELTRFACYLIAMNGDSKKPQKMSDAKCAM